MTELRTALYDRQADLGAKFVDFAGWQMPIQFSGLRQEHQAVRQHSGLFDLGHMGRLLLEGPTAIDFLAARCTRRLDNMALGQVRYSLLTNDQGGVIDDILVSRRDTDSWHIVVNASNAATVRTAWQADCPADVELSDLTATEAMLALQGPRAGALLTAIGLPLPADVGNYRCAKRLWRDSSIWLSRTGYTGEDGVECFADAATINELYEALRLAGATPCGLGARDTLRLEAGMPLYGHELNSERTPIEARLGFAVRKDGSYPGASILANQRAEGPATKLVGLVGDGRRPPRADYPVLNPAGEAIGTVTSGTQSPTLEKPLAMAYVPAEYATPGTELLVDIRGRQQLPMTVTALPFYKRS
jgi:aminomethyltransferase